MICPNCNRPTSESGAFCEHCGAPLPTVTPPPTAPKKKSKAPLIVALSLVGALLLGAILWFAISTFTVDSDRPDRDSEDTISKEEMDDIINEEVEKALAQQAESQEKEESKAQEEKEEPAPQAEDEPEEEAAPAAPEIVAEVVDIAIRQVDATAFPQMQCYANIQNSSGSSVSSVSASDFEIYEILQDGTTTTVPVQRVNQVMGAENTAVNLVVDTSGSMSDDNKMEQAKAAVSNFISYLQGKDSLEVAFNAFDNNVYTLQGFTDDLSSMGYLVGDLYAGGGTAMYDATYASILQTYEQSGAKCVIVFTDGIDEHSGYTYDDVVDIALNTGIPVFFIGIGSQCDHQLLTSLAHDCNGEYYSTETSNLAQALADLYQQIFEANQEQYYFTYTSQLPQAQNDFRTIQLVSTEDSPYDGAAETTYIPVADLSGSFQDSYADKDFILPDSDRYPVTISDMEGLSLAELRIARNEIYARHARNYDDPLLRQWFISKDWYRAFPRKYTSEEFAELEPYPLSDVEINNAVAILEYERYLMATEIIYPNATTQLLSDYDLTLMDETLEIALAQMESLSSTSTILAENIRRVSTILNS